MRTLRVVLVALLVSVAMLAQPRLSFEVSSIKRNLSLEGGSVGIDPGGRFHATNAPVFWLIMNAYGESQRSLLESQVIGAPNWLWSEHYDVVAKTTADVATMTPQEQFRMIP